MEEALRQYADYLRIQRNVSPHTLTNYLSDLDQFHHYLLASERCLADGEAVEPAKVDVHVVRAYLAELTKSRKKSSIARKLAAL